MENPQHVLALGSAFDELRLIGPFESRERAAEIGEASGLAWSVFTLEAPTELATSRSP